MTSPQASAPGNRRLGLRPLDVLTIKLKGLGMDMEKCVPGQYSLLCPAGNGGDSEEKSLSVYISPDGLMLHLHLQAFGDSTSSRSRLNHIAQKKTIREVTEEGLRLEPLCDQLRRYFAERMITSETLQRNLVMQKRCWNNEIVTAFTYRKRGKLVNCKYRDIMKIFWQDKDTDKVFYGLDDIEGESDIIIVEGEMDKLSMEEAGFRNCVSVTDGAPAQVSTKDLPPEDKDTGYQYIWNYKEHLDKVSFIILVIDGDIPSQALAEELARHLGKQRCWRVQWHKKDEFCCFNDANEVLMFLGRGALKEVIENVELHQLQVPDQAKMQCT
ncbi:twinkle homolog protein, chloroplastic/mitochondrial-like [Pistacia vera]|uniref:twinkle homolog protein, chloroplastic/mitochondrial-like n=1 Tax=Pistacia vera TaxID=55513 RepID=UPI00126375F3|nr:twinkle homolog protein, chloroplastic/mitochondrial-like [Pistacia vera]